MTQRIRLLRCDPPALTSPHDLAAGRVAASPRGWPHPALPACHSQPYGPRSFDRGFTALVTHLSQLHGRGAQDSTTWTTTGTPNSQVRTLMAGQGPYWRTTTRREHHQPGCLPSRVDRSGSMEEVLRTRQCNVCRQDRDGDPGGQSGPAPQQAEPVQHAPLQDRGARTAANSAFPPLVVVRGFFGQVRAIRHHDASFMGFCDLLVATKIPQLETQKGTR